MYRFKDHISELLGEFMKIAERVANEDDPEGGFSRANVGNGDDLQDVYEKELKVADALKTPFDFRMVAWEPNVLGTFKKKGLPIPVLKDRPLNQVVSTMTHELAHCFDSFDRMGYGDEVWGVERRDADEEMSKREVVAELASWLVLKDRLPTQSLVSAAYIMGQDASPGEVSLLFPRAAFIADKIQEALDHPTRAEEIYNRG